MTFIPTLNWHDTIRVNSLVLCGPLIVLGKLYLQVVLRHIEMFVINSLALRSPNYFAGGVRNTPLFFTDCLRLKMIKMLALTLKPWSNILTKWLNQSWKSCTVSLNLLHIAIKVQEEYPPHIFIQFHWLQYFANTICWLASH